MTETSCSTAGSEATQSTKEDEDTSVSQISDQKKEKNSMPSIHRTRRPYLRNNSNGSTSNVSDSSNNTQIYIEDVSDLPTIIHTVVESIIIVPKPKRKSKTSKNGGCLPGGPKKGPSQTK